MKKILGLVLLVVALVGCKQGNKVDPNAPLELTVENLAGKWVEDGNPSSYYIFKNNSTYDCGDEQGTYSFIGGNQIKFEWLNVFGSKSTMTRDITLYHDYLILQTIKYIKEK